MMLAQTAATCLAAALVLPDVRGDEPIDRRAYFYANHRWVFAIVAILVAVSMGKEVVLPGRLPDPPLNSIAQVLFIVFSVIGAATARERHHKLFAPRRHPVRCLHRGAARAPALSRRVTRRACDRTRRRARLAAAAGTRC